MGSQFLQQFMAGWQMGQGRNENQRRNQELAMEQRRQQEMMAQRAQEFEMQKEEFAVRKKQLAAQEAEHVWNAKKEAAALMSENQQTLPPETQDLGGGTTLNLGAATQPRAPIMAAIPGAPEGTPEVQVPFFEELLRRKKMQDEQDAQLAATNETNIWKAREPFKISDDERAARLAAQRDAAALAKAEALAAEREKRTKGNATRLRGEYNQQMKVYLPQIDAYNKAVSLTDIPDEARTPQDDIALVFLYMKSLDPTSTVREGEYATAKNAAGVPDQIRNTWNKMVDGKFLTPAQRAGMGASIKRDWEAGPGRQISGIQQRYNFLATDAGINPALVLMDESVMGPGGGAAPPSGDYEATSVPGVRRRKVQR